MVALKTSSDSRHGFVPRPLLEHFVMNRNLGSAFLSSLLTSAGTAQPKWPFMLYDLARKGEENTIHTSRIHKRDVRNAPPLFMGAVAIVVEPHFFFVHFHHHYRCV